MKLEVMQGKIIEWKKEQGYAWISGEDRKRYFAHITNAAGETELGVDWDVNFTPLETPKGPKAIRIVVVEKPRQAAFMNNVVLK